MKRFISVKLMTLYLLLLIVPVAVLAEGTLPEPVLYLDFEQCDGGLYIGDGAYGGVACQQGKFGTAGDFDGIDDGVEIEDSPAYHLTDALTLAAWVRPDVISGGHTIVNKWYAMDSYSLSVANGKFLFSVAFPCGTWGTTVDAESPAVVGEWTHVAGVYDGSSIMLYLNGKMVASAKASGDIQQSTRPISVGNHPSWSAYDGLIDEVRIYDTALTQLQVQELASTIWNPDSFVFFPYPTVPLYICSDNSLAFIWYDSELDEPWNTDQLYRVLISEDEFFMKPICQQWISNVNFWVLDNLMILEPGTTYYWKVEKFSCPDGVISTDIASFVCHFSNCTSGGGSNGWLWGKVNGNVVVQVYEREYQDNCTGGPPDGVDPDDLSPRLCPDGKWRYYGTFHSGPYCVGACGQWMPVTIESGGVTLQDLPCQQTHLMSNPPITSLSSGPRGVKSDSYSPSTGPFARQAHGWERSGP